MLQQAVSAFVSKARHSKGSTLPPRPSDGNQNNQQPNNTIPTVAIQKAGPGVTRPTMSLKPRLPMPTKGPSLVGLLATKRMAKQLTTRTRRKRGSVFDGSFQFSYMNRFQKEPTYRMTPLRKFDSEKVEKIIKSILNERLENYPYNPKFCANMSKVLSDEIKSEVKIMNFDRYKLVCTVFIGQRRQQGVHVSSRCAWDHTIDNYASYTFQNDNIFCTAIVFGLYTE